MKTAKQACKVCGCIDIRTCCNGDATIDNWNECKAECNECGVAGPWSKDSKQALKNWDKLMESIAKGVSDEG